MGISITPLALPEILLIQPDKYGDARGFFSEVWRKSYLTDAGIALDFIQDNHSYSAHKGVLRGLHFQKPPVAQDKLVRCTRGAILDVAVDIRKGSPNYGKWVSAEISAENWTQILVPKGFAHGFLTLTPDCEVLYKVTNPYAPHCDANIRWNDPTIKVDWGLADMDPILSEKDSQAPFLSEMDTGFVFTP